MKRSKFEQRKVLASSLAMLLILVFLVTAAADEASPTLGCSYAFEYSTTALPQHEDLQGLIHEWDLSFLIEHPDALELSPLEMLPICTAIIYSDRSASLGTDLGTFWKSVRKFSNGNLGLLFEEQPWPPRQPEDTKFGEEVISNRGWMLHEPIKLVSYLTMNSLISSTPTLLKRECNAAWYLALLFKLECDLLYFLQDLSVTEGPVSLARFKDLNEFWKNHLAHMPGEALNLVPKPDCAGNSDCARQWMAPLAILGQDRIKRLLETITGLLELPPPLSRIAHRRLESDLERTWLGLDRLEATFHSSNRLPESLSQLRSDVDFVRELGQEVPNVQEVKGVSGCSLDSGDDCSGFGDGITTSVSGSASSISTSDASNNVSSDDWFGSDVHPDALLHWRGQFLWQKPDTLLELEHLRPGIACVERTAEMKQLERLWEGPHTLFWPMMSIVLNAVFSWTLSKLGAGHRRLMLWKGVALIERNLAFSWQACAPAVLSVFMLRGLRWMANLNHVLVYAPGLEEMLVFRDLADQSKDYHHELQDLYRREHAAGPAMWVTALESGRQVLRERVIVLSELETVNTSDEEALRQIRWRTDRFSCHSSIGSGILAQIAMHPWEARSLYFTSLPHKRPVKKRLWGERGVPIRPFSGRIRQPRKLAFLFMVYDSFDHEKLWRRFFEDAPKSRYKILMHRSAYQDPKSAEALTFPNAETIDWWPSSWQHCGNILFGLLEAAYADPKVEKVILLSQDSIPLTTFSNVHRWAMSDFGYSWLCTDVEFTRSELWMLLDRSHVKLLLQHREPIYKILATGAWMDGEDMVLPILILLGERERFRHRCPVYTRWGLPKFFSVGRAAPVGRKAALFGSSHPVSTVGSCGHPTTFTRISERSLLRLLKSVRPFRSWFGRKFARNATVELCERGRPSRPLEDYLVQYLYGPS